MCKKKKYIENKSKNILSLCEMKNNASPRSSPRPQDVHILIPRACEYVT